MISKQEGGTTENCGRSAIFAKALNTSLGIFVSECEGDINDVLAHGLRPIAEAAAIDQAVVYRIMGGCPEKRLGEVYRWAGEGGGASALIEELKVLPDCPAVNNFIKTCEGGGSVNLHTSIMDEGEAQLLNSFGIKSMLMAPIHVKGELWGAVAFQDHTGERHFDEDAATFLSSAARICANFFIIAEKKNQRTEMTKLVMEKSSTLSTILDTAPDLIFCKDLESRYTLCNKSFEDLIGVSREDLIGKTDVEALNATDEVAAAFIAEDQKIFREMQTIMFEDYILSHDGRLILFETIKSPLVIDGKLVGVVGVARDITQRKEMAKQHAEAEAANRAKSAFLATMSHEIRTPMNAILGITEIQLQKNGLAADTKDALNIIYNSGYSLLAIINDLLDLSKIEAGKMELMNGRYETASLINDTVNLNTARIGSKPIDFKLSIDEALPFELFGDELRIKQILNNLLSNAFKYTTSGDVTLSFSVAGGANGANNSNGGGPTVTLKVTVSDTGQGMDEAQVKGIFDAYTRLNLEANRFVEGTGLGLGIVQHLVKLMGGDISVRSEVGKGTEFTLHLAQGYVGPETLGKNLADNIRGFRLSGASKLKKAQIVREHMPYGKVLVVDDMETNLYVARGFLLPYGLTVETALSGPEAIAKLDRGRAYDIIFMDHMMPGMDGMETTKILREKGHSLPIVALTANAVAGQAEVFLASGFDGFISKPIDIRELNASLNKFVRDKQPPEVLAAARDAQATVAAGPPQVGADLAKIFERDAIKAMSAIQEYEDGSNYGGDLKLYITNVHALKSVLANVGEGNLSALAAELERAGRDGARDFISDKTGTFLAGLRAVLDKHSEMHAEEGGIGGADADNNSSALSAEAAAHLRKTLLAIKAACADYDAGAARAALKELKQMPWPRHIAEMLDDISGHLLNSDFDKAEEACSSMDN